MKTISGVPIVTTGIEYQTSTGPVTLTEADLADVILSQSDPAIVSPRLKLGHTDPRFNSLDGEPAFGIADNLRLSDDKQTILCDYVGVPDWLAEILPTAYPSRSIEGNWDVQTVTGHKYRFAISAVALLGVIWPGISTLDDLEIALSDTGPEGVTVEAASVSASTNLEDVRRMFYEEVATEDSNRYWWWVRAVLLDPNELIVDDDEGGLFRVPFTVNGDTIAFSDPIAVKIEYVDAPVAASAMAAARDRSAVFASSNESRPSERHKEETMEASTVDGTLLRRSLGLPEDATDQQVNEALQAQAEREESGEESAPTGEPGTEEPAPGSEQEPTPGTGEGGGESATEASGAVLVDRETLASLQASAQRGAQAFERQQIADRDAFLAAAVQAGKFPPVRIQHWSDAWDRDPEGIKAQIDSMPEGLIPVGARGAAPNTEASTGDPYPKNWLPELDRQRPSTITQER